MSSSIDSPKRLRRQIRQLRRALPLNIQKKHSHKAASNFFTSLQLTTSKRIALYLANDGELDPAPLSRRLHKLGKTLYLPVLHPTTKRRLWFCEYRSGDKLRLNRFGILEPDFRTRKPVAPWSIDVIITPLVGFDESGNRMGMGGGFYDRTFQFLHKKNHNRPYLIGYAHSLQQVKQILAEPWDIPLHGLITESSLVFYPHS